MKNRKYEYVVDGKIVYINLYQKDGTKHTTIIDKNKLEDFLSFKYAWNVCYYGGLNEYYVNATVYLGIVDGTPRYKTVLLHDFLLGFPDTEHIDHKNNKSLDNRLMNLRESTVKNNAQNRHSRNKNNTSGYRNVTLIDGYWRIQLQVDGKNKLFKEKFTDVDLAGQFATDMREKYYGEYAGLS